MNTDPNFSPDGRPPERSGLVGEHLATARQSTPLLHVVSQS